MPTPDINAFLDNVVTRIKAIDNASQPMFFNVKKAAFLDMNAILKIPRWPAAIVLDGSGSFNRHNRDIWARTFSVAIIDAVPRDQIGDALLESMWLRTSALMDDLEYRTDNTAVQYSADEEIEALGHETDLLIYVFKSVKFIAEFDRGA